jgi:Alpha-kinase family
MERAQLVSHTIFIIDNSKSMSTCDVVSDHGNETTRSQAVFASLLETFFPFQLNLGYLETDIYSLTIMDATSFVLYERKNFNAAVEETQNACHTMIPHSHGYYIPALDMMKGVLDRDKRTKCFTNILFLSDGKPSDPTPRGPDPPKMKSSKQIVSRLLNALAGYLKTDTDIDCFEVQMLRFHAIGFGNKDNCEILKDMTAAIPLGGGIFHRTTLNTSSLKRTISSFSAAVSKRILPISVIKMSSEQQAVQIEGFWETYKGAKIYCASVGISRGPIKKDIKISKKVYKSGHEQDVFLLRFLDNDDEWLAKEKKLEEKSYRMDIWFQRKRINCQEEANDYAKHFNSLLADENMNMEYRNISINFPTSYFCRVLNHEGNTRDFYIEPFLIGNFKKWSSDEQVLQIVDEYGVAVNDEEAPRRTAHNHVPSAFSHWSHNRTPETPKKEVDATDEQLICDFRGSYEFATQTFTFVDRVIHSASSRRGKFSHTDKGQKGIQDFFASHKCSKLCQILGLTPDRTFGQTLDRSLEKGLTPGFVGLKSEGKGECLSPVGVSCVPCASP